MSYTLLIEPPNGKSEIEPLTTETVTLFTPVAAEKVIAFWGLSNAYELPAVKAWDRRIFPRIMPPPVLVPVMVILLTPVKILPLTMFTVSADTSLCKINCVVELLVLLVSI
jgi:hypothetical protein